MACYYEVQKRVFVNKVIVLQNLKWSNSELL